jgi:outer membrane protein assembly factor BamB
VKRRRAIALVFAAVVLLGISSLLALGWPRPLRLTPLGEYTGSVPNPEWAIGSAEGKLVLCEGPAMRVSLYDSTGLMASPLSLPGTASKAVAAGRHIYATTSNGRLLCLDLDGQVQWNVSLPETTDPSRGAPDITLRAGRILVQSQSYTVAVFDTSGRLLHDLYVQGAVGHSGPASGPAHTFYLLVAHEEGRACLAAYDYDGGFMWQAALPQGTGGILAEHDGQIYVLDDTEATVMAFTTSGKFAWSHTQVDSNSAPRHSGDQLPRLVALDDRVIVSTRGRMRCLSSAGRVLWTRDLPGVLEVLARPDGTLLALSESRVDSRQRAGWLRQQWRSRLRLPAPADSLVSAGSMVYLIAPTGRVLRRWSNPRCAYPLALGENHAWFFHASDSQQELQLGRLDLN